MHKKVYSAVKVRMCSFRRCVEFYDADSEKFICGEGPLDCECQLELK